MKNNEITILFVFAVIILILIGVKYNTENGAALSSVNSSNPEITFNRETIVVENLPNILFGRSGLNSIDWSDEFDFENLNKRVYDYLLSTTENTVMLQVKQKRENHYGVEYFDTYSVGYLDAIEARKYKDFDAWAKWNNLKEYIERFFLKESDKNSIKINFGPNLKTNNQ